MNRQIASRISGENRGERAMVQLLMAVSVWRTAALSGQTAASAL